MKNRSTITKVIQNFLDRNYNGKGGVLLLNGEWGSGKTHLWKNEIEFHAKAQKNSKVFIYASCFGIESVETLKNQIFISFVTEKGIKAFKNPNSEPIGKLVVKGLDTVFKNGLSAIQKKYDLNFLPLKSDSLSFIEPGSIICLDDLERKDSKLSLESLLGLLSYLSESRACKVIAIADESKLSTNESYKSFKEKVVDKSILIEPDKEFIFQYFIENNNFIDHEIEFLKKIKLDILYIFEKSKWNNLRTLFRIIDECLMLYKELRDSLTLNHVKFLTTLMIEESKGCLKENSQFYNINITSLYFKINQTTLNEEDLEKKNFIDTYYDKKDDYEFVENLYLLSKFGACDLSSLKTEIIKDQISPTPLAAFLNFLNSFDFFFQKDIEMKDTIMKIETLLNENDGLIAINIFKLAFYLSEARRLIGEEVSTDWRAKIQTLLLSRATSGDESFNEVSQLFYSHYTQHWPEEIKMYKTELLKFQETSIAQQSKELLDNFDTSNLFNFIHNKPKNLEILSRTVLSNNISSMLEDKPKWGYIVLESIIGELETYNENIISGINQIRAQLKNAFEDLLQSNEIDKLTKYRAKLLLDKLIKQI